MLLCALTGGIGSGKSLVAAGLRRRNIPVIDADQLARDVVAPGTPGWRAIVERFGAQILQSPGEASPAVQASPATEKETEPAAPDPKAELDRAALGKRIFGDPSARKALEAIVHPRIQEAFQEQVRVLEEAGHDLVCYEIPLLFETAQQRNFDPIISVTAPIDTRVARLVKRDGLDPASIRDRIAAQVDERVRIDGSDFVLHNDSTPEVMEAVIDPLLASIRARQKSPPPSSPKS